MLGTGKGKYVKLSSKAATGKLFSMVSLVSCITLLSACNSQSSSGDLTLDDSGALTLRKPSYLSGRAIDESQVEARVSVDVNGVNYPARQLSASDNASDWRGEVYVEEGSDANLMVDWVETGVEGLPSALDGELLLASYEVLIRAVDENKTITLDESAYQIKSTEDNQRPELDIDSDGFGNLQERLEGSDPDDVNDIPAEVILYATRTAPVIDGKYDEIWDSSQYFDVKDDELEIDNLSINKGVVLSDEPDRRYRWAGMHDEQFLYLMIFAEAAGAQTPFGDSVKAFDDDAIDIFLDGDNSKGNGYDGLDDYHVMITLLSESGADSANSSTADNARFELGDQSASIEISAFEFATCICAAINEQQIYEVKIDLEAAGIPLLESFGFEIQLNNDVDGGERDAMWAWHNDTGMDDTWLYPVRMGTIVLSEVEIPG